LTQKHSLCRFYLAYHQVADFLTRLLDTRHFSKALLTRVKGEKPQPAGF